MRGVSSSTWSCSTRSRRAIDRTCRRTSSGWRRRAPRMHGSIGPAGLFLRRADLLDRRGSRALARRRARDFRRCARRSRRADAAPARAIAAAAEDQDEAGRAGAERVRGARPRIARVRQRLRRVHDRRQGISRVGTPAGPVVERHRQRALRFHRDGFRLRHHVVRKQLPQSADSLEQRSDCRSPVRGRVPAGRPEWRVLDRNAGPCSRSGEARRPVRAGVRDVQSSTPRARRRAHRVRARDRSRQDSAAPNPQRDHRGPRAERLLLRGLVPVGHALALGRPDRHGD